MATSDVRFRHKQENNGIKVALTFNRLLALILSATNHHLLSVTINFLTVLRENFRKSPSSLGVKEGATAVFECDPPKGHPTPVVTWRLDGQALVLPRHRYRQEGTTLLVSHVIPSDEGEYRCVVTNMAGQRVSQVALLTVFESARVVGVVKSMVGVAGHDVTLPCSPTGTPEPQVLWRRADGLMPVGRASVGRDWSLVISSVSTSDQGVYVCQASNTAGTHHANTTLLVRVNNGAVVVPTEYFALYLAARRGDVGIVKTLLQHGANPNLETSWGVTALQAAAVWSQTTIATLLLSAGALPDTTNTHGQTALMSAALYGEGQMVDVLLEAGANPNLQDDAGNTALIWASRRGRAEVIPRLLQAGADPSITDNNKKTAVQWAARRGHTRLVKQLLRSCSDTSSTTTGECEPSSTCTSPPPTFPRREKASRSRLHHNTSLLSPAPSMLSPTPPLRQPSLGISDASQDVTLLTETLPMTGSPVILPPTTGSPEILLPMTGSPEILPPITGPPEILPPTRETSEVLPPTARTPEILPHMLLPNHYGNVASTTVLPSTSRVPCFSAAAPTVLYSKVIFSITLLLSL
nr:neural cell adhesion molecule L1.1-like [Cherax quadricarinatus]